MSYKAWYNQDADYNTNAKSYMDYLARHNKFMKVLVEDYEVFKEILIEEFKQFQLNTDETIDSFQERLDNIKQEMTDFFNQWLADGVLDEVINQDILNSKADQSELETVKTQVTTKADKTEFQEVKEQVTINTPQLNKAITDLTDTSQELNTHVSLTENDIPVTAFMTDVEKEDIKQSEPELDHSDSIQAYIDYMYDNQKHVLYFPSGTYQFKNLDLKDTSFAVKGNETSSGYIHSTFFRIIKGVNHYGFTGSNRQVSFEHLDVSSTGDKNDGLNMSFYINTIQNGAFFFVKNLKARHFSGTVFKGVDLIDSEFYNIRLIDNNLLFDFKPNQWVRSTTVTFNKVYAERNKQVFDVPLCSQSKLVDVILEYNDTLGDITDGSWTIDNLYLENNDGVLDATDSLLTRFYIYSHRGGEILNTQDGVANVDKGQTSINWRQVSSTRGRFDSFHLGDTFSGNYSAESWVKIGRWDSTTEGGRLKMTFLGSNEWFQDNGVNGAMGETTLYLIQGIGTSTSTANSPGFAYHVGTRKPITDIKVVSINPDYRDRFDIYVKVSKNARHVSVKTELNKGVFVKDIQTGVPDPGTDDRSIQRIPFEYAIFTNTGAFRILESGELSLTSPTVQGETIAESSTRSLPITINGVQYRLPLLGG